MMDHSRILKFKTGAFLLALITLSACSSSHIDDPNSLPPETAGEMGNAPEASTDQVPDADPSLAQEAPAAMDANSPPAGMNETPMADAPPASDPSAASSLDAPTVVANNDPAPAPISDAPNSLPPNADPAPMSDSGSAMNTVAAAPMSDPSVDSAGNTIQTNDQVIPEASAPSEDVAAAAPTNSADSVRYQVKRGDTLMKIAFENYGDLYRWKEIYEANRSQISDPSNVPPGTRLSLSGAGMVTIERNGDKYLIKHGDTLGLISHDVYGTARKWKKLWENNRQLIKNPNKIYAGFYLYYQPEGRLTHENPGTEGESAANMPQNLPFKNRAQPVVNTAANTVAPVTPAQMTTTAAVGAATGNIPRFAPAPTSASAPAQQANGMPGVRAPASK